MACRRGRRATFATDGAKTDQRRARRRALGQYKVRGACARWRGWCRRLWRVEIEMKRTQLLWQLLSVRPPGREGLRAPSCAFCSLCADRALLCLFPLIRVTSTTFRRALVRSRPRRLDLMLAVLETLAQRNHHQSVTAQPSFSVHCIRAAIPTTAFGRSLLLSLDAGRMPIPFHVVCWPCFAATRRQLRRAMPPCLASTGPGPAVATAKTTRARSYACML